LPAFIALSCSAPRQLRSPDAIPLENLETRENVSKEIDGHCDVYVKEDKVRALLRVAVADETVKVACVDELGFPLAQTVTTTSSLSVERVFPPLRRKHAEALGIGMRALVTAREKAYVQTGVFSTRLTAVHWMDVFAYEGEFDSLWVGEANSRRYRGIRARETYLVLTGNDTLFTTGLP
jgi:hypothetical protein